tara:strand:- start:286 stop:417 length:132 start_codon:yes stop_codon:yes gene_type:complete
LDFHHIPLIKTAKINASSSIQKENALMLKYKKSKDFYKINVLK